MNADFHDLMREATRLTRAGRLDEATRAIQRALAGGSAMAAPVAPAGEVLDGLVVELDRPRPAPSRPGEDALPDVFVAGSHAHGQMARDYKLYVPPQARSGALPLVVMLHGCTQDPDDFAAGTGMNGLARAQGLFVLYPAQSQRANPQRCWNWFKHTHQQRHRGEPALIASLTRAIVQQHGIDPHRVYVAGLSAGGAMAAVVAALYPELYSAVGIHSGLAPGAAGNLPEALAAMQGNAGAGGPGRETALRLRVPTIVFHGDQDRTVHPRNGEQVIAAVARGDTAPAAATDQGATQRGRRYTRQVHPGADGMPAAEHWVLHGAGHAWSGGLPAGSYTDPLGPDASAEMLRFFLGRPGGPLH